jgi:hypothetical protein
MKRISPLIREVEAITSAFLEALRVQKELGSSGYDLSPEAMAALSGWGTGPASEKVPVAFPTKPSPAGIPAQPVGRPRQAERPAANPPQALPDRRRVKVLFVSDGPLSARSEAGILLAKIAEAMGLHPENYRVVDLSASEAQQPDLTALCEAVQKARPEAVCVLGEKAAGAILDSKTPFAALAGRFHSTGLGEVLPTWHPSTILACRYPEEEKLLKAEVWKHVKMIVKRLKLPAMTPRKKSHDH